MFISLFVYIDHTSPGEEAPTSLPTDDVAQWAAVLQKSGLSATKSRDVLVAVKKLIPAPLSDNVPSYAAVKEYMDSFDLPDIKRVSCYMIL